MAYKRSESEFKGYKNALLYLQKWETEQPSGTFVITHGQAEHSDCYNRLIEGLKPLNWNFVAWDLRGHGRSEGKRGYASHFMNYVRDYEIFLSLILPEINHQPVILLGHSLGGLIQLRMLLEKPSLPITAQVLSSPLLGIAVEIPVIKEKAAHLLNFIYPRITLNNEIRYEQLTRDQAIQKSYEHDPLRHDCISPSVFLGMQECMSYVMNHANKIKIPTFMQIAGKDTVVSRPKNEELFEKISSANKQIIIYKDAPHEIYNDIIRETAYADLMSFAKGLTQGKNL